MNGTLHSSNKMALAAVCLASLMFGLEISSVPVILPTLEKVLNGKFSDMQWVMNAYTIACTTVLMATGTLADRFGRKQVFIISIIAFGVTSLFCGLSQQVLGLIISRLFQGLAGGAMFICSIAILSHQFREGKERSKAFAMWGIVSGIGLGLGPIIGGFIVAISNWQWIFLVFVPLSALSLIPAFAGVQESRDPLAQQLDVWGIVTLSLAVFGLAYYITQGPQLGFGSVPALGILAAAVISFLLFIWVEKKAPHPMFDFSVFRIREFSGAIIGCIGMNFSFWPLMIYLPVYFQGGLGYNSITTGLFLLAYTIPYFVMSPVAERLLLRYRPQIVIPLGLFTIGLGFILMKFGGSVAHANGWTMLPGILLAGIGIGLTNTPVTNTTTGSVSADRAGMASGIDVSARLITLAINIAVMGFILVEGIAAHLKGAFHGAFTVGRLYALSQKTAAGGFESLQSQYPELTSLDPSGLTVHAAFTHGFEWVMLYGGVGVWILALLSFITFRKKSF